MTTPLPSGCINEDVLLARSAGLLAPQELDNLDAHLDTCSQCRQLAAVVARANVSAGARSEGDPSLQELDRGDTAGRYVVLGRRGRGGMGIVYAAHDPDLDRQVALKILREPGPHTRLQREAQAMARLSHPNVVSVFDVGLVHGQVFITLELVKGGTLRQWLSARKRSRSEVLDVFLGAGQGLAAAHDAGIVHRDFKPENVLVDEGGRPRVTDFGLARGTTEGAPTSPSSRKALFETLTQDGEVLGTLFYMSPEQISGADADARSDQFSFCVALFEALYGSKPFPAQTLEERQQQIQSGPIWPTTPRLPARLRKTLRRGLSASAAERFPSMRALLTQLAPVRSSRGGALALAACALIALVGVGAHLVRERAERCSGGPGRMRGVWDEQRKAEVTNALLSVDGKQGPFVAASVARALDAYVKSWLGGHREACEATRVREEQSEEVLGRRMLCLERRRTELEQVVQLLARADRGTLGRASDAVASLPGVDACSDLQQLAALTALPEDPAAREEMEVLQTRLAAARAQDAAGKRAQAVAALEEIIPKLEKLGSRPALAEALLSRAIGQMSMGKPEETEGLLRRAAWLAEASRHDQVAARSWILLMKLLGFMQAKFPAAAEAKERASAAVERAPQHRASYLEALAVVEYRDAKYADALQHLDEAAKLRKANGDSVLDVGNNHQLKAMVLYQKGAGKEALEAATSAVDTLSRELGPSHLQVAHAVQQLGRAYELVGRRDDALEAHRRVLSIIEASPEQRLLASEALNSIGLLEDKRGELDAAAHAFEEVIRLRKDAGQSPDATSIAFAENSLALIRRHRGELKDALALAEHASRVIETHFEKGHRWVAIAQLERAHLLLELGHTAESLPLFQSALEIREGRRSATSATLFEPLEGLGTALLQQGKVKAAIPLLERALSLEDGASEAAYRARARQSLARALGGGERSRKLRAEAAQLLELAPVYSLAKTLRETRAAL